MPVVQSEHIIFIAGFFEILVQLVKGPLAQKYRDYIPYVLLGAGLLIGWGLSAYYGGDPVAGLFEGFFAAASALGFYKLAEKIPVVNTKFGSKGWFADK